jgi:cell division protein FtsB
MTEKKVITLSEFKTVIEEVKSDIKKVVDVVQYNHSQNQSEFQAVRKEIGYLTRKTDSLTAQVALLHEGQTEIKNTLKQKVDREEFASLEMRVARLENKAA